MTSLGPGRHSKNKSILIHLVDQDTKSMFSRPLELATKLDYIRRFIYQCILLPRDDEKVQGRIVLYHADKELGIGDTRIRDYDIQDRDCIFWSVQSGSHLGLLQTANMDAKAQLLSSLSRALNKVTSASLDGVAAEITSIWRVATHLCRRARE